MSQAPKRKKRRGLLALLVAGLAALALYYARCGAGLGLVPGEAGDPASEEESASATDAASAPDAREAEAVPRCQLRLDAAGLTLDGKPVELASAVTRCKPRGADLIVTGDANFGDAQRARDALRAAEVEVFER